MTRGASRFLPYGKQKIDESDLAAVVATLRGDWLTGGPAVDAFEIALAGAVGAPETIACANGTAALHLTAMGNDLGPGDVAIVPAMTFVATANAVRFVGADVVFCDVDPATGLATAETVEAALRAAGPAAKAIYVVHLNGQSADMAGIAHLAARAALPIVEDACHAIGGTQRTTAGTESNIGSCIDSRMAIFSFHPVKTVTTGEGGAVTCRDPALAKRLRHLRSHGITRDAEDFQANEQAFDEGGRPNPWYYEMRELGYNYRITDIQCALGTSQLKRLSAFIERRRALAALYDKLLAPLSPVVTPLHRNGRGTPGWHLYVALVDFAGIGRSRADVMRALSAVGIGTQVHYLPVNRQPYYWARSGRTVLPGADAYYARCLSLPLFPAMTDQDVHDVAGALAHIIQSP